MRRAVRAIVIKDGHLLVMYRNKFGLEYYTLVGGAIEAGESDEVALVRELEEETSVVVANPRLVVVEEAGEPFGTQYVYVCDYVSGEPELAPDSEEAESNRVSKNIYKPLWISLGALPDLAFRSDELKQIILRSVQTGYSSEPIHIQSAKGA